MRKIVVNYDKESDVLYINFHDPPLEADYTNRQGDIIFRSKDGVPIGATIIDFTKYEGIIKLLLEPGGLCGEEEAEKDE